MSFHRRLPVLLGALCAIAAASAQQGLQIAVVEGDGAQSSIEQSVAPALIIEVRDDAGAPVPRAEVTFRSPVDGPSATFFGAAHDSKAWTDENGRAQAAALTPNQTPGAYTIAVEARHEGMTGSAEASRVNVAPEMPKKKRRFGPKIWVPITAGVAVAVIGLAQRD